VFRTNESRFTDLPMYAFAPSGHRRTRFYELWWVAAALCAAGAVTSIGLTPKRHPAKAESHPPHAASAAAAAAAAVEP